MNAQDDSLEPDTALRLERAVLSRIRREQLARRIFWLGTFGALGVVLTLVRPLLSPTRVPRPSSNNPGEVS